MLLCEPQKEESSHVAHVKVYLSIKTMILLMLSVLAKRSQTLTPC